MVTVPLQHWSGVFPRPLIDQGTHEREEVLESVCLLVISPARSDLSNSDQLLFRINDQALAEIAVGEATDKLSERFSRQRRVLIGQVFADDSQKIGSEYFGQGICSKNPGK